MSGARLEVLWVYHSAVLGEWRRSRVEALADHGVDVTVVSAPRWNEGGALVELDATPDEHVVSAATLGTHPYLFAYDPRPIVELLRGGRFDVVDAHEEPASLALAEVLAAMAVSRVHTPVVCYSAQNLHKRYPVPFRWFERRALRRVGAVHSCNDEVADVLAAKGFDGEVVNLGLGVDVDTFSPRVDPATPARPDGPLRVGYVGRLEERKGIFTLLDAARALDGVEVTYVGSGPDGERLGEMIDAAPTGGRVAVRGFVAHDELPGLYRSFDVVVVPSISTASWTEQFGRVVVEAMASGVPVIVSDAGSLPEVTGDAGIIVPEADAAALAAAIIHLRDDPARRAELRTRGLARARDFSWDRIAARQADLYRRVARGRR